METWRGFCQRVRAETTELMVVYGGLMVVYGGLMIVQQCPTLCSVQSDSRHSSLQSLQPLCSEYGPPLQPDQHMCWSAQSFLGRPSWLLRLEPRALEALALWLKHVEAGQDGGRAYSKGIFFVT
jgi:hypothetical protein